MLIVRRTTGNPNCNPGWQGLTEQKATSGWRRLVRQGENRPLLVSGCSIPIAVRNGRLRNHSRWSAEEHCSTFGVGDYALTFFGGNCCEHWCPNASARANFHNI